MSKKKGQTERWARSKAAWAAVRREVGLREAHTYSGIALAAVGVGMRVGAWAAILLAGAILWYIGMFRMRSGD